LSPAPAVGVLGGTFDPVHRGHLSMARASLRALGLETVRLMPAANPPHKTARTLTPASHRLAMLRLAVRGQKGLRVETLELSTGGVCYTIDSLRRIRRGPPECRPVFILGMDSLAEISTWRDHVRLLDEFDLAVAERPAPSGAASADLPPEVATRLVAVPRVASAAEAGNGGHVFRLPMNAVRVSSTEVRLRAASGGNLHDLVPPAVARYIREKRLYSEEERF
jgi:nicotinate-nucleotide adenylyltransferase